jgi:regulation of enolase protein 1 (concanavalin A-like superfamily)
MFEQAKYSYYAFRYGQAKSKISMRWAKTQDLADYAAVWLGVGNEENWIRGGIEFTHGDQLPNVYVEVNSPGAPYKFRSKKITWAEEIKVRLFFANEFWHVGIDGMHSPAWSVKLPKTETPQTVMETLGVAVCSVTINGVLIKSWQKKSEGEQYGW